MNPYNPQLNYLIPLFEAGGQIEDLDQMIRQDGTFASLSDAYWSFIKNHTFEKRVILGVDPEGKDVPYGGIGEWSGHIGRRGNLGDGSDD